MEYVQAIVLGIVQGITEFLPISSDGHLILVPSLLGWERFGLGFDVIMHGGTLLATVLYFHKDIASLLSALFSKASDRTSERRLAWLLLGATIPSGLIGLGLDGFVSGIENLTVARQLVITAVGLLITTAVLGASEIIAGRRKKRAASDMASRDGFVDGAEDLPWPKAAAVGIAQGLAVLPGVSRSGMTIASGQSLGMSREESARFSFLLSLPIVAAAVAKKGLDLSGGQGALPPIGVTIVGLSVTTLVGYAAISFLLPFVRKHSLWWFAAYTGIAGILLLAIYAI